MRTLATLAAAGTLFVLGAAPAAAISFTPNLHLIAQQNGSIFGLQDVEPAVRVDTAGRIFVSAIRGVPAGTDLFVVASNGLSYLYRGQPDGLPMGSAVAPGGGDTDEAIGAFANKMPGPLLITSLNLGTVYSSVTNDGGQSYMPGGNAAGGFVGVDRQWNNAQGGLERYNVVHDVATTNIQFARSLDGGITWLNGTPTTLGVLGTATVNNELGQIVVDQVHHILYNDFASVANATENVNGFPFHTIWVAHSTNDGLTWTDVMAFNGPATDSYNHIFPIISVDAVGNVYAAWSDDHNVFLTVSRNFGATWSPRIQVTNSARDGGYQTHIFPWMAAGGNGGVDIVYYETTSANRNLATDKWVVGFAQNVNVIGAPNAWTYAVASDHVIHSGQICENGIGCDTTQPGNRDLADDFQVALDPNGFANIAYTDDHVTTIPPQTYFTKQVSGSRLGPPNGGGAGHGCEGDVENSGGNEDFALKAPDSWSPGWLTVVANRAVVAAGYVTSFTPSSPNSGVFSGMTTTGAAFSGGITNGNLTLTVAGTNMQVPSNNDSDDECDMED